MVSVAVFATHGLGCDCLRLLHDTSKIEIPLVVTYPPEEEHWWNEDVYGTAKDLGLDVVPISDERKVLDQEIDYLLSVYYPKILDAELLNHPMEGALNLHQAELPRYRGSNVFAHAIMNAREDDHWQYGTTLHEMVEEVDAGPIVDRAFVDISEDDTARTLYDRTRKTSVELFDRWLPRIADKTILDDTTPQEEYDGKRYFYLKSSLDELFEIPAEELVPNEGEDGLSIYDRIRALEFPPLEPAYTTVGGRTVYLTTRPDSDENDC